MPSGGHNRIRSKETDDRLIEIVSEGGTLASAARELGISPGTIQTWLRSDAVLDKKVSRALELGLDVLVDSLLTIPDEVHDVNKARLKCDNIKWIGARRAPLRYGDRIEVNVNGTIDIAANLAAAQARALPIRDLSNVNDAELADTQQLCSDRMTGQEPVISEGNASGEVECDVFS